LELRRYPLLQEELVMIGLLVILKIAIEKRTVIVVTEIVVIEIVTAVTETETEIGTIAEMIATETAVIAAIEIEIGMTVIVVIETGIAIVIVGIVERNHVTESGKADATTETVVAMTVTVAETTTAAAVHYHLTICQQDQMEVSSSKPRK